MDKKAFLFRFRKASSADTLERMYEHMRDKVAQGDVEFFLGAYDHRKA
ncbi:Hha/YmoA family nucleoid-associated regulatory protein [Serratia proteamaculans]